MFTGSYSRRSALRSIVLVLACIPCSILRAQTPDSVRVRSLAPVEVTAARVHAVHPMGDTLGAVITAGKRTELITLSTLDADLTQNAARQVFARVPGVTVWENEGSGVQLSIAARGLSPNRSWEFNLRQNGRDIAADVFGYPEAYYTPPMEAVERIEVVRGAASLAYGPQFGGMVNFVLKKAVTDKPLAFETRQTVGSYGLFDSYNGLGGKKGKWSYYTFLHHRNADGWRANSRYSATTAHASLQYSFSPKLTVGFEYTHSEVEQQQPGGLTDAQFATDPRASARARNWVVIPWNVASLNLDWRPNARTLVDVKLFGLLSERSSVGFVKPITQPDTINSETGAYAARQVDRDAYTNIGIEVRVRRTWNLLGRESVLAFGVRAYGANNDRRQQATGTAGSDADMSTTGAFTKELTLGTRNAAFFVEDLIHITQRLSIVPGARLEHIVSRTDGRINTSGTGATDSGERERNVLLLGLGAQFQATPGTQLFANFSQAYRPVLYSDLTPSATSDVIDPDLKDASGYNVDGGYRGAFGNILSFDVGGFLVYYDDRIGTVLKDGVNFRTNIGTSVSTGVEAYTEADLLRVLRGGTGAAQVNVFVSYAFVDARYTRWNDPVAEGDPSHSRTGKQVEYAPRNQVRTGITYRNRRLSATLQLSAVDGVYADASNTQEANAAATVGWIAGYRVMDANATWNITDRISFSAGVSNLLDESYATRRSGGYPGPGLLTGMGRNAQCTIAARF